MRRRHSWRLRRYLPPTALVRYLRHRADRVTALRWEFGAHIPPEHRSKLSAHEVQFFSEYDELVGNYQRSHGRSMNLFADLRPPRSLKLQVRVVVDGLGDYVLEDGTSVLMERGSTLFLRRRDAEELIRMGYVNLVE